MYIKKKKLLVNDLDLKDPWNSTKVFKIKSGVLVLGDFMMIVNYGYTFYDICNNFSWNEESLSHAHTLRAQDRDSVWKHQL